MKTKSPFALLILGLAFAGPLARSAEPLLEGLGSHTHRITTASPQAQAFFDQGLKQLFGFNHGAAIRSFTEAARLDPSCAMAHWGIALAHGPHINFPLVPPPAAEAAWRELELARKYADKAPPVERALIEALGQRYANPQPEDRSPLDRAYAEAMRKVWQAHPQEADVGVLFAEAMMDLRPWDQWTAEGQAQPGTDEILATLDAVLKLDINHPFANHLYIHAVEASPHPERADAAADRLRTLQPGLAHNVHMPSHIDIRRGRWQEAIDANVRAVDAARKNIRAVGPPRGLLPMYNAHNQHMLAYAAIMTGQSALALKYITDMTTDLPEEFMKEFGPVAEPFFAMPYEVKLRFGLWDDILAAADPGETMPFTRAARHAARGIAFAAKGEPANARKEQKSYLDVAAKVPADELSGNNPCSAIIAIMTPMLEGEILYREGKVDEGLAQLRAAVKAEDALRYDEPPGWILPVRHSLGATLMQERRYAEAEEVYRDDLARLPENGWSLYGLSEALQRQNKAEEATKYAKRFTRIWAKADVKLKSSCFCQPGA